MLVMTPNGQKGIVQLISRYGRRQPPEKETSLIRFLTVSILTFGLIACGRGGLTLAPADDQANNHIVRALDYNNQFTHWMNRTSGLSKQDRPTTAEWLESLKLLDRAIQEAKLVSPDFLRRAHPDLPDMWLGFFIASMGKLHRYYFNAVNDPGSVELPSSQEGMEQLKLLVEGHALNTIWEGWYDQNRDAIRAGIRKMAK